MDVSGLRKDEAGRDAAFTNEGSPLSDVTQLGKNEGRSVRRARHVSADT